MSDKKISLNELMNGKKEIRENNESKPIEQVHKQEEVDHNASIINEMLDSAKEGLEDAYPETIVENIINSTKDITDGITEFEQKKEEVRKEMAEKEAKAEMEKNQARRQKASPFKEKEQPTQTQSNVMNNNLIVKKDTEGKFSKALNIIKIHSGTNGKGTKGYLPNSNLKILSSPVNSFLQKKDMQVASRNAFMSGTLNSLSKYLNFILSNTSILNNNKVDDKASVINYRDAKYLVLYSLLSLGEEQIDSSYDCPICETTNNMVIDLSKFVVETFNEDQLRELQNNDPNAEIAKKWKEQKYEIEVDFDYTDKELGQIDKLLYTINCSEPSIEKALAITDNIYILLASRLFPEMTGEQIFEMGRDTDMIAEIYRANRDTADDYITHCMKFMCIDSINIQYFKREQSSNNFLVIDTEDIKIDTLGLAQFMDLVATFPDDVLEGISSTTDDFIDDAMSFKVMHKCEGCTTNREVSVNMSFMGFIGMKKFSAKRRKLTGSQPSLD